MTQNNTIENLLHLLGDLEEPLGIMYTHTLPEDGLTPKPGPGHGCLINYIRKARANKEQAWFTAEAMGCPGGSVYAGFLLPPPKHIAHFVTTGLPGEDGERYLPEPASMHRFFKALDLQPAPAPYLVVKPLSLLDFSTEKPLLVSFYCRGEALSGLVQLAYFTIDELEAVVMPFGAGCTNLLAWPLHYLRKGLRKAVIGGTDPSCRPFMGVDELSFTISYEMLEAMIAAAPHSFLTGKTWSAVRKRIAKSHKVWSD